MLLDATTMVVASNMLNLCRLVISIKKAVLLYQLFATNVFTLIIDVKILALNSLKQHFSMPRICDFLN